MSENNSNCQDEASGKPEMSQKSPTNSATEPEKHAGACLYPCSSVLICGWHSFFGKHLAGHLGGFAASSPCFERRQLIPRLDGK